MTDDTRSIYIRLADAREEFHQLELKKTGRNKFANFSYFELSDFLIPAMRCLKKQGLIPVVYFTTDYAVMDVHCPETGDQFQITSPMVKARYEKTMENGTLTVEQGASLKACHPIQNLGAVETYQTRYLWVAVMQIVEHDALDATSGMEAPPKQQTQPSAPSDPDDVFGFNDAPSDDEPEDEAPDTTPAPVADVLNISNEDEAAKIADWIIQLAGDMHSHSADALVDFWEKNKKPIDFLDVKYPAQYDRVRKKFTELRTKLANPATGEQ